MAIKHVPSPKPALSKRPLGLQESECTIGGLQIWFTPAFAVFSSLSCCINRVDDGILCGQFISQRYLVQSVPAVAMSIDFNDLGRNDKEVTSAKDPSCEC